MKRYKLTLNGIQVLKAVTYPRLYKYLCRVLDGGLSFGVDMHTLNVLGYQITGVK